MKIQGYEILGEIGRGGMGRVLKARSPSGDVVALKILASTKASARERFAREQRLLATLGEREGFVPFLDAGDAPAGPFLVMPLVTGGTLRDRIDRGALSPEETIELGVSVARALGRAHALGIVHRDVKPENVLFTGDRRPLVSDLGLAKHFRHDLPGASQSQHALSKTGEVRGSLGYMAPEQLRDSSRAEPSADVFSLGAILYECLTGRGAFEGETPIEVFAKIESSSFEALAPLRPDAPAWLVKIIERALAHDAPDRFENGEALARALESRDAGVAAKPRSRRRRFLIAVALLAIVALVGVPAGLALRRELSRRESARLAVSNAESLERDGSFRKAEIERAVTLDPRNGLAWATRARARATLEDWEGAIVDATRAIELDATLWVAWWVRAEGKRAKQDWAGANDDASRALAIEPRHYQVWFARGDARGHKGDLEGSLGDLSRSLELEPRYVAALVMRTDVRRALGDLEGSIQDATKTLELAPRLGLVWWMRGEARRKRGDNEGAIDDATRAIELQPKISQAWATRAEARQGKGEIDGSIEDATRAIELAPGVSRTWAVRADSRRIKGELALAIQDAAKATDLDDTNAMAYEIEADCYRMKGDLGQAILFAELAIALDATLAPAYCVRGEARLRKGEIDGAIEDATRALELGPDMPAALATRALALKAKGDLKGAIADYTRFLELAPDDPFAPKARADLAELRSR